MARQKPQINFQVSPAMKQLYEAAKQDGFRAGRLCAAGFLWLVENPDCREQAIERLRDWEAERAGATLGAVADGAGG